MMRCEASTTFAVQYLEGGPGVAAIAPEDVRARLRAACEVLPISLVLLGWNLPPALVRACREEASRAGAQLYLWHPLLTGHSTCMPRARWRAIGLDGTPVPGFRGLPECTFVCPNRPAVHQAALQHLHDAVRSGSYDGVFLDRIRYASPAANPSRLLACFCDDCRQAAGDEGLDLEAARGLIRDLTTAPDRAPWVARMLLEPQAPVTDDAALGALWEFLCFRVRGITRFVSAATEMIHSEGLAVGLDCFSPALTHMVGQDLGRLDPLCDWIKIMTYGHALGPAGLPFELLDLSGWLVGQRSVSEAEALEWMSLATRLPLPPTQATLRGRGIAPEALGIESRRARAAGVSTLLAGMELVEIEGICALARPQIIADLRAFRTAGVDGLVLSWDLWHIPLERLELVRRVWVR